MLPDGQTYRETDGHTERQTDRRTERQTDRHTDRQTDRHTERQTDGWKSSSIYKPELLIQSDKLNHPRDRCRL